MFQRTSQTMRVDQINSSSSMELRLETRKSPLKLTQWGGNKIILFSDITQPETPGADVSLRYKIHQITPFETTWSVESLYQTLLPTGLNFLCFWTRALLTKQRITKLPLPHHPRKNSRECFCPLMSNSCQQKLDSSHLKHTDGLCYPSGSPMRDATHPEGYIFRNCVPG